MVFEKLKKLFEKVENSEVREDEEDIDDEKNLEDEEWVSYDVI